MSEWQPIETMPEDNADDVDARFLQAAQSVPVVGEPVAWACPYHAGEVTVNGTPCMLVSANCVNSFGKERGFPLRYVANAIPATELATLREKAAEADESA